MRIGPVAHGVLLVAALAFGYQTWTRDKTADPKTGKIPVWDYAETDFESLQYDEENKSVMISVKQDKGESYLWGVVKTSRKAPKPPKKEEVKPPLKQDPAKAGEQKAADPSKAGDDAKKAPDAKAAPDDAKKAPDAKAAPDDAKKAPDAKAVEAKTGEHGAGDPPEAKPADDAKKPPEEQKAADAAKAGEDKPAEEKAAAGDAPMESSSEAEPPLEPAIEPEPELITTTREFPIGEDGEEFRKNISALRALRQLGKLDEAKKQEYGLAEGTDNLVVMFKGGKQRTLIIGKRVFGGSDRYMIDPDSGTGYVISGEIMNKISGAENSLGLKKLNGFEPEKLHKATIKTPGGEKNLIKGTLDDPDKGTQTSWADEATPLKPDLTFANFMDRVEKLRPTQYVPDVDPSTAKLIASILYKDDAGKQIGFLELYRKEPSPDDKPEQTTPGRPAPRPTAKYYIRTEKTRVLGEVTKLSAERAHQDFAEMFGAEPPPAAPEPPTPDAPTTPGLDEPGPREPPPGMMDPHGGDPHGGDPHGHGAPPEGAPPAGGAPAQPAPAGKAGAPAGKAGSPAGKAGAPAGKAGQPRAPAEGRKAAPADKSKTGQPAQPDPASKAGSAPAKAPE